MAPLTKFSRTTPIKLLTPFVIALFLICMDVGTAHAYLDPGTGSVLLQSTLALIAGTAVTLKLYWSRLKDLILRKKPDHAHQSVRHE
jgi:hypothetical protein